MGVFDGLISGWFRLGFWCVLISYCRVHQLFFMGLKIAELGEYSMSIPSMVLLWGLFVSLSPRNTTLKLSRNHDLNNFAPTNISP